MRSRSLVLSFMIFAATSALYSSDRSNSYVGMASIFSIGNKTEIPGKTLAPGQYSILVVDQYSDRMLVKVENEKTKDYSIFLGVPQPALDQQTSHGPLDWQKGPGGSPALRGYAFSPGTRVEFVYPKDQAVQIATKNAAKVVAVDPASEGLPPVANMSKDDARMVSLWALSLSTVAPNDKKPAIAAAKYEGVRIDAAPQSAASTAPAQPQQIAKLEQPNLTSQGSAPEALAPAKRKPVIAKLPHTASPMSLIALWGAFFLMASLFLRLGLVLQTRYATATGK
jgi:hypothetical protein